jgi:hypothetical protein
VTKRYRPTERRRCSRANCGRNVLVNKDGSLRAHRKPIGTTRYLGNVCRDPHTGKAHTTPPVPKIDFHIRADAETSGQPAMQHDTPPEPEPDDDEYWHNNGPEIQRQALEDEHARGEARRDTLLQIGQSAVAILSDILAVGGPCQIQHGRCRTHDWLKRDIPCPLQRARELLQRYDST